MLTIITGLPGHGKTLNTLIEVHTEHAGKRPIYYNGIDELKLEGWTIFDDVKRWYELEDGAVIVVDESQRHFPQRGLKDKPEHVAQFETHRHRGHDIYLITQDAKLIDHNVRRLAGRHIHFWRAFGVNGATRWEWQRVVDPHDRFAKQEAVSRKLVRYDKRFFGAYKSATLHTVKRTFPKKVFLLPVLLVLLVGTMSAAYAILTSMGKPEELENLTSPITEAAASFSEAVKPVKEKSEPIQEGRITGIVMVGSRGWAMVNHGSKNMTVDLHTFCQMDVYKKWLCDIEGVKYTQFSISERTREQAERARPQSSGTNTVTLGGW